jgi:hypothetical protein
MEEIPLEQWKEWFLSLRMGVLKYDMEWCHCQLKGPRREDWDKVVTLALQADLPLAVRKWESLRGRKVG